MRSPARFNPIAKIIDDVLANPFFLACFIVLRKGVVKTISPVNPSLIFVLLQVHFFRDFSLNKSGRDCIASFSSVCLTKTVVGSFKHVAKASARQSLNSKKVIQKT
jgi:hypothetical protein